MAVEDKHMKKLKDDIKEEVTFMFEQALDFAQVDCPDHHFRQIRNNCIFTNIFSKIIVLGTSTEKWMIIIR